MKDGRYGLGILGLGGRGVYFGGNAFRASGGFYIPCVCDLSEEKCIAARRVLGEDIRTYTDIDAFLQDPELDAVIVATPDYAHAECAKAVLKARKHLYLEKPMAQTIEDCDALIEAWKGSGTVFMVGLELRYCTLMQQTKALIEAGEIGQIRIGTVVDNVSVGGNYFYHNRYRYEKYVKSLVLQKGTHSLDLANWLVDSAPVRVFSSAGLDVFGGSEPADKHCTDCEKAKNCPYYMDTAHFQMDYGQVIRGHMDLCVYAEDCEAADNSLVLIDYENGARITYLECHFTPEYTREFMFIGDRGKIEAFYNNEQEFRIKLWKRHEKEPVYFYPPKVEGGHGGGDTGIIREFFERIRCGKPCMKGVRGARDSAAIAIAAFESEKTGLPVKIPKAEFPPDAEL
ncbi:MAG: Gfo/Idh/MocA family oxidoreductase [Eubacteriales bacterium]|nr:Gfo/Idh/MocA family oxidoreductase [Eubacteriales bacterium]